MLSLLSQVAMYMHLQAERYPLTQTFLGIHHTFLAHVRGRLAERRFFWFYMFSFLVPYLTVTKSHYMYAHNTVH